MQSPLDVVEVVDKGKEYGAVGLVLWIAIKLGSSPTGARVIDFALNTLNIRLTRRQTLEERVAELSDEFSTLRAEYRSFAYMVADAADAMDKEMSEKNIDNPVLRVFVDRLQDAKRVSDALGHKPPRARRAARGGASTP